MTNLRKLVLVAVIAVPLALCAQPIEKPDPQIPKSTSTQGVKTQAPPRNAFQKILHGLNPVTWAQYLSKREYCTYAYSQAYGVCEGSRGGH
jgi:hypothetical protein